MRVLHLGNEAPYRGVRVAEAAVAILRGRGISVELVRTGGSLPLSDVIGEIRCAVVVVACGLCEPWGMRVNDALMEGTPVIVSDGMGVAWLVTQFGCGCVVPKGDADALANVLERFSRDGEFREALRAGVACAREEWTPVKRAKALLRYVLPH